MKNRIIILCLVCLCLVNIGLFAQETSPRTIFSLNEGWECRPITTVNRKAPFTPVTIPHTWNTSYIEGTTLYERKMMVYQRPLVVTKAMKNKRLFLYFEGVNSAAQVFMNRRTVGEHLGGYTAFCIEITDEVKEGENLLEVWASNAYRTDILPVSGDFNVNGGIHRPCHLIVTGQDCISPLFYASPGVFIHQENISKTVADVNVETHLSLKNKKQGLRLKTTVADADNKTVASNEVEVSDVIVKQPMKIHVLFFGTGRRILIYIL